MSVTKRRQQAINRLRLQRIPADATSVMKCSCGGVVYLRGDNPSTEDREWFDMQVSAHDYCDAEVTR